MKQGVQTLLAELGEAACLALCICELGKPGLSEAEAVGFILDGIKRGYIFYDEKDRGNPSNCFVQNRDAFMELVTGEKGWASSREGPGYKAKPGEKLIECWNWEREGCRQDNSPPALQAARWDPSRTPVRALWQARKLRDIQEGRMRKPNGCRRDGAGPCAGRSPSLRDLLERLLCWRRKADRWQRLGWIAAMAR